MAMKRNCPVCGEAPGGANHPHRLELPDELAAFMPQYFWVAHCDRCNMVYNSDGPGEQELAKYYASEWYRATRPYRNEDARCEAVADRLAAYHWIYEIGPGDGQLERILKERGHCYRNFRGNWLDPPQIVVLNHVLEHVLNPRKLVDSVRTLAPLVYVEVPNGRVDHVRNFEHVNYFEEWTLRTLLGPPIRSGFDDAKHLDCVRTDRMLWGIWPLRCYIRGYGHKAWNIIPHFQIPIVGVIDLEPKGMHFRGQPVLSPDDQLEPGVPVVICVDSSALADEIAKEYTDREVAFV